MKAHEHEIHEMLEFRRVIETQVASLAAMRRTDEELATLEKVSAPPSSEETVTQWHFDFHDALAKAAHNRFLEQAMIEIRGELFVPTDWVMTTSRALDIENLHDRILEAVRDRDSERASLEMSRHLDAADDAADAPFRQALGEWEGAES